VAVICETAFEQPAEHREVTMLSGICLPVSARIRPVDKGNFRSASWTYLGESLFLAVFFGGIFGAVPTGSAPLNAYEFFVWVSDFNGLVAASKSFSRVFWLVVLLAVWLCVNAVSISMRMLPTRRIDVR
jgi:hypothetical protein